MMTWGFARALVSGREILNEHRLIKAILRSAARSMRESV
jgi:hypothetical protein